MLTFYLAFLVQLARAIVFVATPKKLHFHLGNAEKPAVLSSLKFYEKSNVVGMARLLGCKEVPTDAYYEAFNEEWLPLLTRNLVDHVMENVFPHPQLHRFYFPFKVLSRNARIRNFVLERIDEYHPGVVSLGDRAAEFYDERQLISLLNPVARFPYLLGDYEAGRMAWKLGISQGWEIDSSLTLDKFKIKIEEGHDPNLLIIGALCIIRRPLEAYINTSILDIRASQALIDFLSNENWLKAYRSFLKIIIERTKNNPSRSALWHGRLLLGTLSTHNTQSEETLRKLFIEYFTKYDHEIIPPFVASQIVEQFRKSRRLHFNDNISKSIAPLLHAIETRYSAEEGFWGGLDSYAHRFVLSLQGGRPFDPPIGPCDVHCACEFFARGVVNRENKVLFQQFLPRPFQLLHSDGSVSVHYDIVSALEAMTKLVFCETNAFSPVTDGLAVAIRTSVLPDSFWSTAGRLIIYNLIYRGTIGVKLSKTFWRNIYGRMNPICNVTSGNLPHKPMRTIASELSGLNFISYFPEDLVVAEDTRRLR